MAMESAMLSDLVKRSVVTWHSYYIHQKNWVAALSRWQGNNDSIMNTVVFVISITVTSREFSNWLI